MSQLLNYERHLPHRFPPDAAIFLTFRLADTLPRQFVARLHEETALLTNRADSTPAQLYAEQKRYFGRFDHLLNQADFGQPGSASPQLPR